MGLYRAVRPLAFACPPETAHRVTKTSLAAVARVGPGRRLLERTCAHSDPILSVDCLDMRFRNPVGVAAGFDKDATAPHGLASLGFGFVEVGTVTPYPQPGNEPPRLFRLPKDRALINRMGLNGAGMERVARNLESVAPLDVPVGVNVGPMNDAEPAEAVEQYRTVYERLAPLAEYVTVNVSCPNTPGATEEDDPEHLRAIFDTLPTGPSAPPLLVKIGPDSPRSSILELLDIVHEAGVSGIVATNTTTARPPLDSEHRSEMGGLSGRPLADPATAVVRTLADHTDLPIVGVGGIDSPERAYERIRAGATLLQLYTGLVYEGPTIAGRINRGLANLLRRDGFDSLEEAIGVDAE